MSHILSNYGSWNVFKIIVIEFENTSLQHLKLYYKVLQI